MHVIETLCWNTYKKMRINFDIIYKNRILEVENIT